MQPRGTTMSTETQEKLLTGKTIDGDVSNEKNRWNQNYLDHKKAINKMIIAIENSGFYRNNRDIVDNVINDFFTDIRDFALLMPESKRAKLREKLKELTNEIIVLKDNQINGKKIQQIAEDFETMGVRQLGINALTALAVGAGCIGLPILIGAIVILAAPTAAAAGTSALLLKMSLLMNLKAALIKSAFITLPSSAPIAAIVGPCTFFTKQIFTPSLCHGSFVIEQLSSAKQAK